MRNWFFAVLLLALPIVYVQQAVAQKEDHKAYANMKIKECNDCHKNEGIAVNHDADWLRGHRLVAQRRTGNTNCAQCHDQAFCLDCHTGGGTSPNTSAVSQPGGGIEVDLGTQNFRRDYIPKSHKSDWIEIHPIKAQDNPQSCLRCHDQKNCQQCHSRYAANDLQFLSHRRQFRDIKVSDIGPNHAIFNTAQCPTCHRGGILPSHQWSSDHATEARRNLQSCGTCHSDGDVCMTCHSARTGLKVNPHPRSWNSVKSNYRDKSNGRTCVRCHDNF